MGIFKKLSRTLLAGDTDVPRGKAGARAYADGDIHGRLDLLNEILKQIEDDMASRAPK